VAFQTLAASSGFPFGSRRPLGEIRSSFPFAIPVSLKVFVTPLLLVIVDKLAHVIVALVADIEELMMRKGGDIGGLKPLAASLCFRHSV
jgi:hypothetical protein